MKKASTMETTKKRGRKKGYKVPMENRKAARQVFATIAAGNYTPMLLSFYKDYVEHLENLGYIKKDGDVYVPTNDGITYYIGVEPIIVFSASKVRKSRGEGINILKKAVEETLNEEEVEDISTVQVDDIIVEIPESNDVIIAEKRGESGDKEIYYEYEEGFIELPEKD